MKFLVPNYSCLQNPWLRGYRPQIPVLSVLNWICWTPPHRTKFLGTLLEMGKSERVEGQDKGVLLYTKHITKSVWWRIYWWGEYNIESAAYLSVFYIHGSVHRESNLITVQQDATYSVYYISVGSSTCFACWHPSLYILRIYIYILCIYIYISSSVFYSLQLTFWRLTTYIWVVPRR